MEHESRERRARRYAELRYAIIGGLLASPPEGGQLQQAIAELATTRWSDPVTKRELTFAASTIERWYYQAKDAANPIGALTRKPRIDVGRSKAMGSDLLAALEAQYRAHKRWSHQLHADNLAAVCRESPERYGRAPSYSTVRRRMVERDWLPHSVPRHPTPAQREAAVRRAEIESAATRPRTSTACGTSTSTRPSGASSGPTASG